MDVHLELDRKATSSEALTRPLLISGCSVGAVSSHPGPFVRLGTADPIPRFVIGFKTDYVFDYAAWAKGLDLPISAPGIVEFKNNAQFLHCLNGNDFRAIGDI